MNAEFPRKAALAEDRHSEAAVPAAAMPRASGVMTMAAEPQSEAAKTRARTSTSTEIDPQPDSYGVCLQL